MPTLVSSPYIHDHCKYEHEFRIYKDIFIGINNKHVMVIKDGLAEFDEIIDDIESLDDIHRLLNEIKGYYDHCIPGETLRHYLDLRFYISD